MHASEKKINKKAQGYRTHKCLSKRGRDALEWDSRDARHLSMPMPPSIRWTNTGWHHYSTNVVGMRSTLGAQSASLARRRETYCPAPYIRCAAQTAHWAQLCSSAIAYEKGIISLIWKLFSVMRLLGRKSDWPGGRDKDATAPGPTSVINLATSSCCTQTIISFVFSQEGLIVLSSRMLVAYGARVTSSFWSRILLLGISAQIFLNLLVLHTSTWHVLVWLVWSFYRFVFKKCIYQVVPIEITLYKLDSSVTSEV